MHCGHRAGTDRRGGHRLARIIHDGSLRSTHCNSSAMGAPPVALRDGRVEPQGREAYSLQYGDRLSGEPARLHACRGRRMQVCRSSEWAIAAEALMNNAG